MRRWLARRRAARRIALLEVIRSEIAASNASAAEVTERHDHALSAAIAEVVAGQLRRGTPPPGFDGRRY